MFVHQLRCGSNGTFDNLNLHFFQNSELSIRMVFMCSKT